MRSVKAWVLAVVFLSSILAVKSFAEDRYVRLRSVEGEVSIHPSDNQRGTEATINTPLLDGDEIQTGQGRAELSFQNGITVRIGDYSGVRLVSTYSPMRIDLLQGTAFLDSHLIDKFRDELVLNAGQAEVILIDEGNIRVDLGTEGSVRVTTFEGQAEVQAGGRRVLLNSGERTYVDPGRAPLEPEQFRGEADELDQWNDSRIDNYAQNDIDGGYNQGYVDEDIYYDSYDLDNYGDWRDSGQYGNVWVPRVGNGWRPYYDGRWSYTNNSWFWISYEPWGWAPYHYGRWGWGFDLGWYWIPGNVFGPSWVSWYSYGDYIGWCPMNYNGYPNYYDDYYYNNNRYPAVQKQKTLTASNSWTFVNKNDLGVTDVKKRVLDSSEVRKIKFDRDNLRNTPKAELVNYVIPKTRKVPAFVNDKSLIKQPGDIKNPSGVKNRDEKFERPGSVKGAPVSANKGKTAERAIDKTSKTPVKIQPGQNSSKPKENLERDSFPEEPVKSYPKSRYNSDRSKSIDRDSQFKRNESSKQYSSPYSNPYLKGKTRTYENESSSKTSPWYRKPSNDPYERPNDVNPKYRDEAKKYFERFDHKSRGDSDSSAPAPAPKNYEPSKNYEPPSRNSETPKRDYKAPEYKRQDNSNRSNQNNNRSKPSSNSNNNSVKKKPN